MTSSPAESEWYTIQAGDSLWSIAQRFHTAVPALLTENPGLSAGNLPVGRTIRIPRPLPARPPAGCISRAEQALSRHMRLLWEQHVYWTRMVILSIVFALPDLEAATNRLLRNPKDFEEALRPFYGKEAAGRFAELFTSHLGIAAELVKAAKADDGPGAADAERRWYENADQIAAFLGGINPYWPVREWQKMLYDHLAMTKAEAVELLTGKYEDSIRMFEAIEREALRMADEMTRGITRQFPSYFG